MNLSETILYNLVRPIAPDWFSKRYASRMPTIIQRLDSYNDVVSKAGIHSCGPRRKGFGDLLKRVNDAGRMLGVVKCRDDFGAAYEAKQLWPHVLTVGAFTDFDGLNVNLDKFVARAKRNPWIDYWEVYNENNGEWAYQANTYIDKILPRFRAEGLRLAMFSCASGTPPLPSEDNGAAYAEIARACRYAINGGFDTVLCLHEYVSEGGTIGRYKVLRDYLLSHGAMLPVVISEWGYETNPGDTKLVDTVKALDPLYMADEWVEGLALWTLGGGGWGDSNYEKAIPRLAEYIATVPPVDDDPPPPPEILTVSVRIHSQYLPELTAWCNERGGTVMR